MDRVLAGRYELHGPLGSGGMATVYRGFDRLLDRPVAVKLLHRGLTDAPHQRERVLREAQAAARLGHPNAVAIFDLGTEEDRPYLVMELVEGGTLAERLTSAGPLPPGEAVDVATAVLGALHAAHARGLVHRDVKPSNVLLGDDGRVRLADFGIAKALEDQTLTATGQLMGTPAYLAPEQVLGHPATPASDLYGVGVLCYEMLAGKPPFSGPTALATALAHERQAVPPLTEQAPVPAPLAAAVHRALEKDPAKRHASAAGMAEALRGGGADRPTQVMAAPTVALAPDSAAASRPAPGAAAADRRLPGRPLVFALVGLLALAAAAFTLGGGLAGDEVEPPPEAGAPDGPGMDPDAEPGMDPDAEPGGEDPEPPPPETLSELIALVADDPARYGEKGPDLLDHLVKVAQADDVDRPKEARKAIEKAQEWAEKDELDAGIAADVERVLGPAAEEPDGDVEDEHDEEDEDEE